MSFRRGPDDQGATSLAYWRYRGLVDRGRNDNQCHLVCHGFDQPCEPLRNLIGRSGRRRRYRSGLWALCVLQCRRRRWRVSSFTDCDSSSVDRDHDRNHDSLSAERDNDRNHDSDCDRDHNPNRKSSQIIMQSRAQRIELNRPRSTNKHPMVRGITSVDKEALRFAKCQVPV